MVAFPLGNSKSPTPTRFSGNYGLNTLQRPAPPNSARFCSRRSGPYSKNAGVLMTRKSSPRTYEITPAAKDRPTKPATRSTGAAQPASEPTPAQLAASVTRGIPDDIFKASDAQSALKDLRPDHPAASYTATQFGTWFAKQLWPIMEQHGVVLASEKPRRYEMTPDAPPPPELYSPDQAGQNSAIRSGDTGRRCRPISQSGDPGLSILQEVRCPCPFAPPCDTSP